MRWVSSVGAMAGMEGVWCAALAVVTTPLDLHRRRGGGVVPPTAGEGGFGSPFPWGTTLPPSWFLG